MVPTKVSKKGQITIPKEIRDRLGLEPGQEVEFQPTDRGYVLRRKSDQAFPRDGIRADDPLSDDPDKVLELTRGRLE